MSDIYYSSYLGLDKILDSQHPVSAEHGVVAHDEMLFIITHQAYELWFKQIMYELDSIILLLQQDDIDDNSGDMGVIVRRARRIVEIWKLLIQQIDILETMSSVDFLEFRNFLIPASGFQSVQFKLVEAKIGLRMDGRHGGEYYKRTGHGGLSQDDFEKLAEVESQPTVKRQLIAWLERMPFFVPKLWDKSSTPRRFWAVYRKKFLASLNKYESLPERREEFNRIFLHEGNGEFSPAAMRSALFIMLYRDYPIFQLPYQLLTTLLDIDEHTSIWRYRHLMMLSRMIGMRVGTGGINREGKNQEGYLEGALKNNRVLGELSDLSTYFIERRNLPPVPISVIRQLGFSYR
ncbi:MAG: tryptophan 2,3-dioxygenase [Acidobacteriota bacterium]|jgi:tryptophan 2,3-dioxygenase|nr:tryptophan 2,3-dioxygenase [Acidobacteriota bacterium]